MAEQFRLHQFLRNGSHIQRDKSAVRPRAVTVQCARNQFFTGARLAIDQNSDVALRKTPDRSKNLLHSRCVANDFGCSPIPRFLCAIGILRLLGLGSCNRCNHFFDVEGLGQILEGTFFVGIDGTV